MDKICPVCHGMSIEEGSRGGHCICKGVGRIMGVTRGDLDYAIRRALNNLDKWNDVAGVVTKLSGYYFELQSVIVDAVHCGFQQALNEEQPLPSERE